MKKRIFAGCLALCLLMPLLALAATLSYGSTGDDVTALQERLTELGYYTFRITGNYQENTRKAVREFQEAYGLEATGVADEPLQALIHSADAQPRPTPTPAPTPVPINLDAPYPGKIARGDAGDNVRRIQTRLKQLGFYTLEISGNYQNNTRDAVKAFQEHNHLQADGIVGEVTWQWLFFEPGVTRADDPPKPPPYRIYVDLTNQVTSAYQLDENNEYTVLVRHMICSTGTASDPTDPGTYVLNGATSRWCYFPKWGTHAQYWTRIDSANAFHSVIYSEPDPMALKTASYTGLGKPASHGCIRLMIEDAKWIYQNITKGTEVVVFEGKKDEELTKSLKIPPLDKSVMLPEPTPAPTLPPVYSSTGLPPMPFTTLEKGMESEAVYWLQCKLADLGYYDGTITGGYYSGTVEAVQAFQRANGLSADGKAGAKTLNKLYENVLAEPAPSMDPANVLSIRSAAAPSPTPPALPTPTAAPSPSPTPGGLFIFPNAIDDEEGDTVG